MGISKLCGKGSKCPTGVLLTARPGIAGQISGLLAPRHYQRRTRPSGPTSPDRVVVVDMVLLFCYMFFSCSTTVQTMADETAKPELQSLSDRIADLEFARDTSAQVEGFEGIRQLSHAIETQQLDRFALQNSTPDRVFWGSFWTFVIGSVLLLIWAALS